MAVADAFVAVLAFVLDGVDWLEHRGGKGKVWGGRLGGREVLVEGVLPKGGTDDPNRVPMSKGG